MNRPNRPNDFDIYLAFIEGEQPIACDDGDETLLRLEIGDTRGLGRVVLVAIETSSPAPARVQANAA